MKRIMPDFHADFACIGGACTDNCCIGWEIDIDRATLRKYQMLEGDFGAELRASIEGEPAHFRLQSNGRCAMLNEQNLCRIILHGGESLLCEICDQHPRFRGQYGDRLEVGAGICCEVAARQWLLGEGALHLVETEAPGKPPRMTKEQSQRLDALVALRKRMLEILAEATPLGERLARILALADQAQRALDAGKPKRIASLADEIPSGGGTAAQLDEGCLMLLAHMEPIDDTWRRTLVDMQSRMAEIRSATPEFLRAVPQRQNAYARLAMYALYRYLLKGAADGDCISRAKWAVLAVWIVRRMDVLRWLDAGRRWDDALEIDAPKLFSKQVEYSQQNMDLMLSECWNSVWFSTERIVGAMME